MISHLLGLNIKITIYIRFSSENIYIRYVEKQKTIEGEPLVAIKNGKKRNKVVAIGRDSIKAQFQDPVNVTIHNPFQHPRTFLSNFEIAEATLRHFVCKIFERKILVPPIVIFHPTENIEGGVTQIEFRALYELGVSIGAKETLVWTGRSLTDNELNDINFLKKTR